MIKVENITKHFNKFKALDTLNISLEQGECVALIGPNGCGKTTLIKSVLGMVLPEEGSIYFDGEDIKNDTEYRRKIGYMPQIGRYPENMTIGQVIDMIKGIRNDDEVLDMELYERFEIDKMLDKKMRTLSGGTTQKVSAVLAFMFQPKVLILDEPTAGLDPIASEILKTKILDAKNKGCLILITSHLLSELEDIISQIVFMQDGKILFHKDVAQLKTDTQQTTVAKSIVHLLREALL
jgi:Cu-processing system ATP-binding protein